MSDDVIDTALVSEDTQSNSATQSPENASAGSASAGTPASEPTGGTSADAGTAVAETQPEVGQQASFKVGAETKAVNDPAAASPYEKQYRDAQSWNTKISQQN